MLKSFGKDVLTYGSIDAVTKLTTFLVLPVYAKILTVSEFGMLALVTASASIIESVANCGLNNAVQRFYFDASLSDRARKEIVPTGLYLLVCTTTTMCMLFMALCFINKDILFSKFHLAWLPLSLALAQVLPSQISQYILDVTRLHFSPRKFAIVAIVRGPVGILVGLLLLVRFNLGIEGVILGSIIASLLSLPVGLWLIREDLGERCTVETAKRLVHFGYPFVFASAAYWIFGSMDRWMLARLSDSVEVGLFSIAIKFASVLTFLIGAFAQAWSPYAMRLMKDDRNYRTSYSSVFSVGFFILAFAGLFLALFSGEIMWIMTPVEYWGAAPILAIMSVSLVLFGTTQVTALGITLEKRTHLITAGAWSAAVGNVTLNFLLIPKWGANGAAVATLFSYALLTSVFLYWTQRLHPLPLQYGKLAFSCGVLGVALAAPLVLSEEGVNLKMVVLKLGILLVVFLGAASLQIVPRHWGRSFGRNNVG